VSILSCLFRKKPVTWKDSEQTSLTWIVFGLSSVDDVYAVSDKLEKAGCSFKKKPDEGRMKGLAFVYDPDGYWGRDSKAR
jgi:hypothetical protein